MLQDVRYAVRTLGRAPAFTAVALVTLALGIGGTTAIFSVVDGILLRPLPYPEPSAIIALSRVRTGAPDGGSFSAAEFLDLQRDSRSFAALAGYRQEVVDLTGSVEPVRLRAVETTAAFFDVFGLPPLMGRVYSESTDAPGGPRVTVLSEGMWRQHLGGDPGVVGRTVRLNGVPFTVLGVMPAAHVHPDKADLWMLAPREVPTPPLAFDGDLLASRDMQYFNVIGRLAPDATVSQARDELQRISERLASEFPNTNAGEIVVPVPYHEQLVGDVRTALLVLLGAVGFVLLIACANVASLLLARGTGRRRELALRTALGAGRGRLLRQLLIESLVLAGFGGLLGLLVAYWGLSGLLAFAPTSIPRLDDIDIDLRVVGFALLASVFVGVLFGLVPAWQGSRLQVTEALKDGGRTGSSRSRVQSALVVGEVALALVLLIGAGLMLTSFVRLRAVNTGFTVDNLVVVGVALPLARYDAPAQVRFYDALRERLLANPVTARSALTFPTPFGGGDMSGDYVVEGKPPESRPDRPLTQINSVTPGYFQTMGIPLLAGRDLSDRDTADSPAVVVINQTFAEREWPGEDPIGRRILIGGDPDDPDAWFTVVGVVADSLRRDLHAPPSPAVYLSHRAFTLPLMSVVVRTDAGEAAVASAMRSAVRALDPELPIGEAQSMTRVLERTTGQPRFRALLVSAFAGLALILAAVGIYGLVSYTVAQRVPEIGVRLALGASRAQVGWHVIGRALRLVGAGIGVGLLGALGATRLLEGLLFSVSAVDPVVYATLAGLLLAIGAVACYVPARRAMRVDPMTALRAE